MTETDSQSEFGGRSPRYFIALTRSGVGVVTAGRRTSQFTRPGLAMLAPAGDRERSATW
jgi:hypothetical protein